MGAAPYQVVGFTHLISHILEHIQVRLHPDEREHLADYRRLASAPLSAKEKDERSLLLQEAEVNQEQGRLRAEFYASGAASVQSDCVTGAKVGVNRAKNTPGMVIYERLDVNTKLQEMVDCPMCGKEIVQSIVTDHLKQCFYEVNLVFRVCIGIRQQKCSQTNCQVPESAELESYAQAYHRALKDRHDVVCIYAICVIRSN